MKRDMDLCRKILIEIESWPTTLGPRPVEIDGYTDEQIGYNAWLLAQEGLIKGRDRAGIGRAVHAYSPSCLTYQGHDFLEHARNDTRWKTAKDKLVSTGGPITIQAMKTILDALTKAGLDALTKAGLAL